MVRCLLVDDSEQFLVAARRWLEQQGIAVVGVATTVAEAGQQRAALRPDVVLVDIDLRGESGFAVAEQLGEHAEVDPVRVILISSHAEEDYAELIATSSAIGFLPKTSLSGQRIRDLVAKAGGGGERTPVTAPEER